MAKKAYIGVNNVAHKIKKGYIGVNGVARKIKKAYIGVGGIARPCFGEGVEYYGTITSLSVARSRLAATSVGNYALFGGGYAGTYSSTVDAYSANLTRSLPTGLNAKASLLAATTVGNYALFAGGKNSSYQSEITAYNNSLTKSSPANLGSTAHNLAAATVGNYALFAGGDIGQNPSNNIYYFQCRTAVTAYNNSLTKSSPTELREGRTCLAASTVGDYALFAGGFYDAYGVHVDNRATVTTYNKNLTQSSASDLSMARNMLAATTVGDYALFAGGEAGSGDYSTVDVYNKNLTKSIAPGLSVARSYLAATTVGNYALFGGGIDGSNNTEQYSTVDMYDINLTKITIEPLSVARLYLASTTVGNFALFAGGKGNNGVSSTVDAYMVN